jgi:organic radical activating enzyme
MSDLQPAKLVEMFSSAQGEGPYVGVRQVFLRFAGCNLACTYCDTAHEAPEHCQIEATPGRGDFMQVPNPVHLETVLAVLARWTHGWPGLHHSISLTGGEPLLAADILMAWLPELSRRIPVFLETNGTLPDALAKVLPWLRYVSMDMKLPSASGHPEQWDLHRAFLLTAKDKEISVKLVVNAMTEDWEIQKAATIVHAVNPAIPFILQPCSPSPADSETVPAVRLLALQELAGRFLADVRIIPQTHKCIGLL